MDSLGWCGTGGGFTLRLGYLLPPCPLRTLFS